MEKILTNTYTYKVLPQDLDGKRHFRAVALERVLLNVAGQAAVDRDFGAFKLIDSGGVSWVLLRFAVEMSAMPSDEDTLSIETWVESVHRILTSRDFIIRNQAGEVIGYATSEWTVLNLQTRRPVSISPDDPISSYVTGQTVPIAMPGKLPSPSFEECPEPHRVKVSYSDIDYNGHTNSMQYLQWMLDSYPIDKLYSSTLKRLEINYIHEVRHGETVNVYWQDTPEGTLFAVRDTLGAECVRARIIWR